MELKPGYKQTEVGMIPEDWMPSNIGDVATFSGGSQPPRSTFRFAPEQGYIRLIQIRDYKTDEFVTYIPESMVRKRCNAEDIMIGRYGPPIFQMLRGINGAYNVALIKAIPNQEIHHDFFFYILKQEKLFHFIDSLSQRSSGQTGVEMPALKGYGLPLPPFPEQRSIATALSDMDELLGGLDRLIIKKRDLKQSAMQELLTGKTRLLRFGEGKGYKQTELGLIPEDWEIKKLGTVASYKNGVAHEQNINESGKFIVVNSKFISTEGLIRKYSDDCFCPTAINDVLMVMSDVPNGRAIAKCFWVNSDNTFTINQRICILSPCNINGKLLFYKLDRNPFYLAFDDGAKQTNLRKSDVLSCPLVLPTLVEEQNAIASILSDMDTEIATLEQRRNKTRDLKQAMMQELLTGRIGLL